MYNYIQREYLTYSRKNCQNGMFSLFMHTPMQGEFAINMAHRRRAGREEIFPAQ